MFGGNLNCTWSVRTAFFKLNCCWGSLSKINWWKRLQEVVFRKRKPEKCQLGRISTVCGDGESPERIFPEVCILKTEKVFFSSDVPLFKMSSMVVQPPVSECSVPNCMFPPLGLNYTTALPKATRHSFSSSFTYWIWASTKQQLHNLWSNCLAPLPVEEAAIPLHLL